MSKNEDIAQDIARTVAYWNPGVRTEALRNMVRAALEVKDAEAAALRAALEEEGQP
jgi:hypothetical protein